MINELFRELPTVPTGGEIEGRCLQIALKENPKLDVASHLYSLNKRKEMEQVMIGKLRSGRGIEVFDYFDGLYDDLRFFGERPLLTSPLTSAETSLIEEIQARIDTKEKPVTLVDFGGGAGFSMIRIASRFEDEIRAGRAAVVVTNAEFLPFQNEGVLGSKDIPGYISAIQEYSKGTCNLVRGYTKEELQFLREKQHLVHFIRATAPELFTKFLMLPNGQQFPLAGNIDIFYEMMALMHSSIPEITLAYIGHALAENATMQLHISIAQNSNNHEEAAKGRIRFNSDEYMRELAGAMMVGLRYLEKYVNVPLHSVENFGLYERINLRKVQ